MAMILHISECSNFKANIFKNKEHPTKLGLPPKNVQKSDVDHREKLQYGLL